MELVRGGEVCPPHLVALSKISDMAKALSLIQSGKHIGKLVIVPRREDTVKVQEEPYYAQHN